MTPGARPVSAGDLGNATFTRLSATTGYAAVAIREAIGPYSTLRLDADRAYVCAGMLQPDGGEAVLAVELVARDGTLKAARVGRTAEDVDPRHTTQPREQIPVPVGDGQPAPEPPEHMRAMLGEFPRSQGARERWLLGAAVIDTYRERHDVHDPHLALGSQPEDPEQRAERDRAVGYLLVLTREIDSLEPDRASETPGRDLTRRPDLER